VPAPTHSIPPLSEYDRAPVGGSDSLDPSDWYVEEAFVKLRIVEGVPASWFSSERYGRSSPRGCWKTSSVV
jgi:hypothetical protein